MRIIKVESCRKCPYKDYYSTDFYPPYPKIYYKCSYVGKALQENLDGIPDWCTLGHYGENVDVT